MSHALDTVAAPVLAVYAALELAGEPRHSATPFTTSKGAIGLLVRYARGTDKRSRARTLHAVIRVSDFSTDIIIESWIQSWDAAPPRAQREIALLRIAMLTNIANAYTVEAAGEHVATLLARLV